MCHIGDAPGELSALLDLLRPGGRLVLDEAPYPARLVPRLAPLATRESTLLIGVDDRSSLRVEFTVPAGSYPAQYDPIATVGSWSFVLSRADLDESVAFRLAQNFHRLERMTLLSKQLSESNVKNTLMAVPNRERLHPGVLAYYKKAGLLKE